MAFRPRVAIGTAEESESYNSGSRRNGVHRIYQAFPIGQDHEFVSTIIDVGVLMYLSIKSHVK